MTNGFGIDVSVVDRGGQSKAYDINLDLNGRLTLDQLSQQLRLNQILIARAVLREEQADGFDRKPIVRVDGVSGRSENQVKPFGKIEYFSRISDLEVLLQVYRAIEERSPVRSGLYKNSNYVLANNRVVAKNEQEFFKFVKKTKEDGIAEINEIRFINVTPYASRLEYSGTRKSTRGLSKGKNISKGKTGKSRSIPGNTFKKPNGTYYLASRTLSNIKGFFAQVKYEFIPNGHRGLIIDADGIFRNTYANTKKNQAKRRVGKPYVYPSIVFRISKQGVGVQ